MSEVTLNPNFSLGKDGKARKYREMSVDRFELFMDLLSTFTEEHPTAVEDGQEWFQAARKEARDKIRREFNNRKDKEAIAVFAKEWSADGVKTWTEEEVLELLVDGEIEAKRAKGEFIVPVGKVFMWAVKEFGRDIVPTIKRAAAIVIAESADLAAARTPEDALEDIIKEINVLGHTEVTAAWRQLFPVVMEDFQGNFYWALIVEQAKAALVSDEGQDSSSTGSQSS